MGCGVNCRTRILCSFSPRQIACPVPQPVCRMCRLILGNHLNSFLLHSLKGVLLVLCCLAAGCRDEREQALSELERKGRRADVLNLMRCIKEGDRETLQQVIRAGLPPGALKESGESPVVVAITAGRWDLIPDVLPVSTAASLNSPLPDGSMPLQKAADEGRSAEFLALLSKGANPSKCASGGTLLTDKVLSGGDAAMRSGLLASLSGHGPASGLALVLCAAAGDEAGVRLLLGKGVPPDTAGGEGKSVLRIAAEAGHTAIAQLLVDFGAAPAGCEPALCAAVTAGDAGLTQLLLDAGVNPEGSPNAFARAMESGKLAAAEQMMKAGVRPENYAASAIKAGDTAVLSLFYRYGMHPDRPGPDGNPALIQAAMDGNTALVAWLLDNGASLDATSAEGQTAWAHAAAAQKGEVLKLLLERGVPADTAFNSPPTPEFAARLACPVFEKWLAKDSGLTALMLAAARGDTAMLRQLTAAGAKRGTQTKGWKRYPINFACEAEQITAAQILLGRNPESENRNVKAVISRSQQRVRIYKNGEVIRTVRCSTGKPGFATPAGKYVISDKQSSWISSLYDVPMPHFMRLSCRDFGLHAGVVPGYPASHGCIRLPKGEAATVFSLMQIGDPVTIE